MRTSSLRLFFVWKAGRARTAACGSRHRAHLGLLRFKVGNERGALSGDVVHRGALGKPALVDLDAAADEKDRVKDAVGTESVSHGRQGFSGPR